MCLDGAPAATSRKWPHCRRVACLAPTPTRSSDITHSLAPIEPSSRGHDDECGAVESQAGRRCACLDETAIARGSRKIASARCCAVSAGEHCSRPRRSRRAPTPAPRPLPAPQRGSIRNDRQSPSRCRRPALYRQHFICARLPRACRQTARRRSGDSCRHSAPRRCCARCHNRASASDLLSALLDLDRAG